MKYYTHISKCPMIVFEDCYCDDNLESLVYEGECPETERYQLQAAWMDLKEQYAQAIGDTEQLLYLKMLKEVNVLQAERSMVVALLDLMPNWFHPAWGKAVCRIVKITIAWAPGHAEYHNQLDSARRRIKGLEMTIDLKKIALQQQEKKMLAQTSGRAIDREFFASVYNIMEEVLDCKVDPSIMTVQRYCERLRRLNKKYKKTKPASYGRGLSR